MIFGKDMSTLRKLMLLKAATGVPLNEYEASGNPLTFETNKAKPLISLLARFTPVQSGSGDPSPTNVRSISGWSGVNVWHSGVNVFDGVLENGYINTTTGENTGTSNIRSKNYIPVVPGQEYRIVYVPAGEGSNMRVLYYKHDKTYTGTNRWVSIDKYTIPSDVYFMRFYMDTDYTSAQSRDIAINYPSTETEYAPYTGHSLPVTFPAVGKNLLNVDRTEGNPNPTTLSNATSPRVMDTAHYFVGIQSTNYYYKSYCTASVSDGVLTVESNSNNSYGVGLPVAVKGGTQYTLSATASNVLVSFGFYDDEWNYISGGYEGYHLPLTATTPQNASYMVVVFRSNLGSEYTYSNIMLNEGGTAQAYEPYTSTIYGGSIDLVTGVLTATMGIVALNAIPWNKDTNRPGIFYGNIQSRKNLSNVIACDTYLVRNEGISTSVDDYVSGKNDYGERNIFMRDTAFAEMSASEMIEAVTGNLVYELATPKTYPLTPQQVITLAKQLNTIWSDTNGTNEAVYLKKG